jgi:hypothetical protein
MNHTHKLLPEARIISITEHPDDLWNIVERDAPPLCPCCGCALEPERIPDSRQYSISLTRLSVLTEDGPEDLPPVGSHCCGDALRAALRAAREERKCAK